MVSNALESKIKLTKKQEDFCQAIFQGDSQVDAYKKAYNTENQKLTSIYPNASALMLNTNVMARINELRNHTTVKAIWTFEDSLNVLKGIALNSERDADKVAAVKEANAMLGFKATIRHDVTSNGKEIGLNTITIVAAEKQVNEAIDMIDNDNENNLKLCIDDEADADYIDV